MNSIFRKIPWLSDPRNVTWLFCGLVFIATAHRLWLGEHSFNNFTIFRYSFYNLIHGNDLYALHPDQYYDLYKYSPTFAFLMAPFYALPNWLGIFVFNLLNALLPFWAINKLNLPSRARSFILLFIAIELLSSIQNAQTNGIMTGLIIGAFVSFERKNVAVAALFICLGFYLKIFAAVAGILFLFYDNKWRFLLWCFTWGVLLAALPVLVTGLNELIIQYKSWFHLLANDPAHDLNFSIMTLTQKWFHFTLSDKWYLIPGILLLLLPLARMKLWETYSYRLLFLSSILIWVVIFNHKAESPTYVIAVAGVGIASMMEGNVWWRRVMLWFVFIFTTLSPTDLFPRYLRAHVWQPYCLIALPCILVWLFVVVKLLAWRKTQSPGANWVS